MSLEPAVGVGSKNPLFGYDLVPLASYVVNFKSLGPKLWKFFTENDQISPVKYKSIDLQIQSALASEKTHLTDDLSRVRIFFRRNLLLPR